MLVDGGTPFEKFLKSNGIPYLPPRKPESQDVDYCFSVLTSVHQGYEIGTDHEETLENYLFSHAVRERLGEVGDVHR